MAVAGKIQDVFSRAFGLQLFQKKRLNWVDYLRGIVIILVVYHHARIGIERSGVDMPQFLVTANIVFYSFRIPLFFLVSGIFFSRTLENCPTSRFVSLRFENLLYPYLIWATIQVTAQIFLSAYTNTDRSVSDYLYIFYQPRKLDQFYYLPALFNVTIIYLLIKTYLKPGTATHLAIALVFYMTAHLLDQVSIISDWMTFYIFFAIGDALAKLFFENRPQKAFSNLSTFLFAIPLFALVQFAYLRLDIGQSVIPNADWSEAPKLNAIETFFDKIFFLFIVLAGCFMVTTLSFQLQKWRVLSYLRVIGYHSLHIYVLHVMVVAFTRVVLKSMGVLDPFVLLFSCITVGILVPIVFYNVVVKTNWGWYLFHFRRRPAPATPRQSQTGHLPLKPIENTAQ